MSFKKAHELVECILLSITFQNSGISRQKLDPLSQIINNVLRSNKVFKFLTLGAKFTKTLHKNVYDASDNELGLETEIHNWDWDSKLEFIIEIGIWYWDWKLEFISEICIGIWNWYWKLEFIIEIGNGIWYWDWQVEFMIEIGIGNWNSWLRLGFDIGIGNWNS